MKRDVFKMFDEVVEKTFHVSRSDWFDRDKCRVEHYEWSDFDTPKIGVFIYNRVEQYGLTCEQIEDVHDSLVEMYMNVRLEQKLSELMDDHNSMMQTAEYEETERGYLP